MILKEVQQKLIEVGYFALIKGDTLVGGISIERSDDLFAGVINKPFWITIQDGTLIIRYPHFQLDERRGFKSVDELMQFIKYRLPEIP